MLDFRFAGTRLHIVHVLVSCSLISIIGMGNIVLPASPTINDRTLGRKVKRAETSSIDNLLDETGALREDIDGTFNADGYEMIEGQNGAPLFVPSPRNTDVESSQNATPCSEKWDARFSLGPGLSGKPSTMDVDVITVSGNDVYIGGVFESVGGVAARNIAKWNRVTSTWSALGSGTDGAVLTIAVSNSAVYAAGQFNNAGGIAANRIAKWENNAWSALGSGLSSTVNAVAVLDNDVYAGGLFTTAGGNAANYIAKWSTTNSNWSALGSGLGARPETIAVANGKVYAGGWFTTAGGSAANYIASWNPDTATWSPLGTGASYTVHTIVASGNALYVGGDFNSVGATFSPRIAKWDLSTSSWSRVGSGTGPGSTVDSIAVVGTDVYFTGWFPTVNGSSSNYVGKWDGVAWSTLGSGLNDWGQAMGASGTDVFVGGKFSRAGSMPASRIAKWNGSAWQTLPDSKSEAIGPNSSVNVIVKSGSNIYVGGAFTDIGGLAVNRIAKWDGTSWSALGTGLSGAVNAMVFIGTDLYVGGNFTQAGGQSANRVAKWDGSTWTALGTGLGSTVLALATDGTDLFVGGFFTTAGGSPANYIAKWNGSSWSTFGSGFDNSVNAIAVVGSDIYAGGQFTTAGGGAASRIARWNGSSWLPLGSGLQSVVTTIVAANNLIYVGGWFTTAGGNSANRIAAWNPSTSLWSALGTGMGPTANDRVYSIAVSGTDVYAGGNFTTAGGNSINRIARWNGSSWSAVAGGVGFGDVNSIMFSGADIYIGGDHSTSGCINSGGFSVYRGDWNSFQGTVGSDWSTSGNWDKGNVPNLTTDAIISDSNVTVSGDYSVRNLQVNKGMVLTISVGSQLSIQGTLILDGVIAGDGELALMTASPGSSLRTETGRVKSGMSRTLNSQGSYSFPVGTDNGYSPVTFTNIIGTERLFVRAFEGAYVQQATGLSSNRIPRWWNISTQLIPPPPSIGVDSGDVSEEPNGQTFSADVTFGYPNGEITLGAPGAYKAWRIENGIATNMGGTNDPANSQLTVLGIGMFSDWTLAGGRATAAPVAIAGRVLDENGRPVSNARVLITKPDGDVVTVKTNSFGYYRLTGISAGETYVVMAQTRRNLYVPRVITPAQDLTNLDLRP